MKQLGWLLPFALLALALSWPDGGVDRQTKKRLLEIAKEYQQYDPSSGNMNMAPALCAAAAPIESESTAKLRQGLGRMYQSNSSDGGTHGQKAYKLFVSNAAAYANLSEQEQPVGQVLVKESWTAKKLLPGQGAKASEEPAREGYPHYTAGVIIDQNSNAWQAGEKYALFVMYKKATAADNDPDTDQGWVYAVTSVDGENIVEAGKLSNCMGCHTKSENDRLFGIPTK